MKAKIQEQHRSKFNPFYTTVIGGQVTKVSLKDAEENAENYINTPMGVLYEDFKKVKKEVEKRQPEKEFEVLDMQNADTLGDLFDKEKRGAKKKEVEKFLAAQKKRMAKIEKKAAANLAKKKKAEADAKAKAKAEKDALLKAEQEAKAIAEAEADAKAKAEAENKSNGKSSKATKK